MRRGHKVHIVADSYGENGGHFEKLVMLGADVSTAAPRAEFDGNLLRIYIQRRPSRPATAITIVGAPQRALDYGYPLGVTAGPASPPSSAFSSSDLDGDHSRRPSVASSFASIWSSDSSTTPYAPLSPSLDSAMAGPSSFTDSGDSSAFLPPPCTARAGPAPDVVHKPAKRLTGPEGARAAAKAAREEAAKRAKEEAKRLPKEAKGGRWLPFRKQKEQQQAQQQESSDSAAHESGSSSGGSGGSSSNASSGASGSSSPDTSEPPSSDEPPSKVERNGTIKALSRSHSPLPPLVSTSQDPTARALDSASDELSKAIVKDPSLSPFSPSPVDTPTFSPSPASTPAPKRPSFRSNNLTLRPFDRSQSFVEAAVSAAASHGGGSPSASSDGGVTPSVERMGMRFTQASS